MYVVVQFCPLFNFIFLSFNLIIIHFQTPRQRKMKIKPRIKLNHNIYSGMFLNMQLNSTLCLHEKPKRDCIPVTFSMLSLQINVNRNCLKRCKLRKIWQDQRNKSGKQLSLMKRWREGNNYFVNFL